MKIVAAGPAMAHLFAAVHAQSFAPSWSAASFHGMLLGMGAFGLIAMDGDAPCGMVVVSAAGDNAEILTIGVVPGARRRGCAHALMRAAEAEALKRGAGQIVLDVAADNIGAQTLYKGLGFVQVGARTGYYRAGEGTPRDAFVLQKKIASSS